MEEKIIVKSGIMTAFDIPIEFDEGGKLIDKKKVN